MSLNKVQLIGSIGKDPEIHSTQDGREIATLSLATSEKWKDKNTGEKKEKTEWHKVVIFNPNIVGLVKNYVKKGSKIYIEGQLETRKWTDKDGVDRYTTEVVLKAFNGAIELLDSFKKSENQESASVNNESITSNADDLNDDIPF